MVIRRGGGGEERRQPQPHYALGEGSRKERRKRGFRFLRDEKKAFPPFEGTKKKIRGGDGEGEKGRGGLNESKKKRGGDVELDIDNQKKMVWRGEHTFQ